MNLAVAAHAPLAVIDLNGTGGTVLLVFYIIGGLALAGTSWLPGNSMVWKIAGTLIGIAIVIWAAVVLVVGGWIPISFYVLILPILGVVRAVRAMAMRRNTPAVSPYGAQPGFAGQPGAFQAQQGQYGQFGGQPGGQQFGAPGYPQQQYAPQQDGWNQAPQAAQPYTPPGTESWGQAPQQGGGWGAPPQQPQNPQQPPQPGGWNG